MKTVSWGWCLTPIRRMKPESNPMLKRKKRTLKSPPRAMAAARGKNESGAESWYTIRAAADNAADISIYDEIGGWGISAHWFAEELVALGSITQINLHIHSPGGSIFDGLDHLQSAEKSPGEKSGVCGRCGLFDGVGHRDGGRPCHHAGKRDDDDPPPTRYCRR